ncbi:hypothetical protein D3C76_1397290 [compost metagenome]
MSISNDAVVQSMPVIGMYRSMAGPPFGRGMRPFSDCCRAQPSGDSGGFGEISFMMELFVGFKKVPGPCGQHKMCWRLNLSWQAVDLLPENSVFLIK